MILTEEELENEVWKDLDGYEGIYQISNLGRVKSFKNNLEGKILKVGSDNKYQAKTFTKDGNRKSIYIHRLVLETFTYKSEEDVDHINGLKNDNRLTNLRYLPHRDNINCYYDSKNGKHGATLVAIRNNWRSTIRLENERYFLGNFSSKEEAHNAYKTARDNWEKYKKLPYIKKLKISKSIGVYRVESTGKFCTYFQKGYYNIYLGTYDTEEEAYKVYENAVKEWDDFKKVPYFINESNTSICKFVYYHKKAKRWYVKIKGKTKSFKTECEAVDFILSYEKSTIMSEEMKNHIKNYIQSLPEEILQNIIKIKNGTN